MTLEAFITPLNKLSERISATDSCTMECTRKTCLKYDAFWLMIQFILGEVNENGYKITWDEMGNITIIDSDGNTL